MNYKSTQPKIIIGGYERTIPSDGKLVSLIEPTNANASADAMFNEITNTLYQVTSGKTFHLLGLRYSLVAAGGGTLVISQGDTEDAETVTKVTLMLGFELVAVHEVGMDEITFASAKFITINPSTTNIAQIRMVGYEI